MEGLFSQLVITSLIGLFASNPSSTNFTLDAYDFGTGGGSSSSSSYQLNSISGTQAGDQMQSSNYGVNPGLIPTQNANVPPAPAFTNPDSSYNRLRFVLNNGGNPSDTKFAIAISTDNFVTTNYIQSDHTVGAALGSEDYQSYSAWSGAGGFWVLGLTPATTYEVKVKAMQGNFTETGYGPIATQATVQPSISFAVETSATNTPPFNVSFGNLTQGSVISADADAVLTVTTNALYGGALYIRGTNGGLNSSLGSYTLSSSSVDLDSTGRGYGGLITAISQSSGGPLVKVSPYDGSGNVVGGFLNNLQPLAATSSAVNTGSVTVRFKAKTDIDVPASADYTDTLTFVAAMIF